MSGETTRSIRRAGWLGVVLAAILALAPGTASAAVTCDLTGGTLTVTVTNGTPFPTLSHDDNTNAIIVDENTDFSDGDVACTNGPPADNATGNIVVNEVGSNQGTNLRLDFERGRLEPGLGAEPSGVAEIEIDYQADANGDDVLVLDGNTESADQSFQFGDSGGGVTAGDLNGDDDSDDVSVTSVDRLFLAEPGTGDDTFTGDGTGSASFTGPTAIEMTAFGSEGNETFRSGNAGGGFTGGPDDDSLIGGTGADSFHMEEGNDTYDGGGGSQDFASYENFTTAAGVTLDLSQPGPQDTGPDTGIDQVANAENLVGSNGPDELTGTSGDNLVFGGNLTNDIGSDRLNGLGGNDTLPARAGNDSLIGGPGDDMLLGETGTDTVSFALGSTGPVTFSLDPLLTNMSQTTGGAGSDTLLDSALDGDTDHDVENLIGSPFGMDTLTGNALANRISVLDGFLDTADCVGPANGNVAVADEVMVDAISNCEVIDNAPQTSVVAGPANGATITTSTTSYTLMADEAASFQVSVNGGAFQACPASCGVGPLPNGAHVLAFRAVDSDENGSADQTPATRTVTVAVPSPASSSPPPGPAAPQTGSKKKCKKNKKRRSASAAKKCKKKRR